MTDTKGAAQRRGTVRHHWMDLLRGVAVLLVALWHVLTVPELFGAQAPAWLRSALTGLGPYRIPLLLFLSGLLLPSSLRKGWVRYASGKLRLLVWPFVVWTLIMAVIWPDLPRLLTPETWWRGSYHLWFLSVLAWCYLAAPLTKVVPAWIWPVPLVLLSAVAPNMGLVRLCWFGAFFFAGAAVVRVLPGWQRQGGALPSVLGLTAVGYAVWAAFEPEVYQYRHLPSFAVSLCGVAALMWFAPRLPRLRGLEWVGRHSIVIYLAHFPAIALTWQAATALGLTGWWTISPFLLLAGVVAPLVMVRWADTWLFRAPQRHLSRAATR